MIIELKCWEGVEEETVTIWTFLLHYPSRVRRIVRPPTFTFVLISLQQSVMSDD